ncbi:metalloregulator ArsR/SmtB family transcription factor [Cytophagales bacterium LB-30]|uniref:Metalloregulator ArsR/SmtB family transcription factor n=1 Tax=Shiella aurantiaca TaxID=3058365 RepID=A0ABT8F3J2_9BACT|nr:metalloregulator ArsR/SmtB family transcription factor [Shiella aurantiaca]MDN4165031.1 metalloregulator ArsR/SmtB family transcription factor [Shiella aurantiaca]
MEDELKRLARIMKALSNENRLSLYLQIYKQDKMAIDKQECFVSHIAHHLNIGAPTVSHHIKELENAGLITLSRVGKQVTASINPSTQALVQKVLTAPEKL